MYSIIRTKSILLIISALLFIKCSDVTIRDIVVSFNEFVKQISVTRKGCKEIKIKIYPMFMGIKDSLLVLPTKRHEVFPY